MQTVNTEILTTISGFISKRYKRSVWLWQHAGSVIVVNLTVSQDLHAGNARAELEDPQFVPVGRDHHSSPVRRTYIEESHPGLGVISGRGFGACAGPRGYAKVESTDGTNWAQTTAWGGSSSGSYAYAGQNGVFGGAAPGSHAVAMCGSGSNFTAAIYEPGEQVTIRHSDGSKSRGRGKVSDSKDGGIRYVDEDKGGIEYSGGNKRGMRYIDDEDEGAIRHSVEYREKKQKAFMFGNKNHRYYER